MLKEQVHIQSKKLIDFAKAVYKKDKIALHEPVFSGNEAKYVMDTIESTYVSSVGAYVDKFEKDFAYFIGAEHTVATVNGTAALHISLLMTNVQSGEEVLISPMTFIAPVNAIRYCNADPIFIDIDASTLALSSNELKKFLVSNTKIIDGECININSGKVVKACILVHVFGIPADIDEIQSVCDEFNIRLIEDASEALGSYYKDQHVGTFGDIGVFSFNGNKTITTGGGGMLVFNNQHESLRAKHLTTTAKKKHAWNFVHDQVGYNYRMPNINAALGCGQLERLPDFLKAKKKIADQYKSFCALNDIKYFDNNNARVPNYWLNTIVLDSENERDFYLQETNNAGVMTRPVWELMTNLPMFKDYQKSTLENAVFFSKRILNLPSSPILE